MGGFIGKDEEVKSYVDSKVQKWVQYVDIFSKAAVKFPQAVYAAFTKSLQCEWNYLQRVIPSNGEEYLDLKKEIERQLIPAIFGREILDREFGLLELPAKWGGMGLRDPVKTSKGSFDDSLYATLLIQNAIKNDSRLNIGEHNEHAVTALKRSKDNKEMCYEIQSESIINSFPLSQKRVLHRVLQGKMSGWLSVLPIAQDGFDLSAQQFRDQLALRYGKTPLSLPADCDGCDSSFSLQHGLDCPKGGLIKKGHDNLRDECAQLAELAWGNVKIEPIIKEASGRNSEDFRADFCVRGVWEGERLAFFDNRILNADAPSRIQNNISFKSALKMAANEKRNKYKKLCEDIRSSITPLVCTTDGCLHREFSAFLKRLAVKLSANWRKPYSHTFGWVKVRVQFALIRAIDLRLRGSRKRIRGLGLMDGAGAFNLSYYFQKKE